MLRPWGDKTNFINVLDFDVKGFLDKHYDQLWTDTQVIAMQELKIEGVVETD